MELFTLKFRHCVSLDLITFKDSEEPIIANVAIKLKLKLKLKQIIFKIDVQKRFQID